MKDWTEALKEKFLEDRVTLPDGELEILEGLIRRRKQKRILSWTAVSFAAVASVALIIGFASRETEQTTSPASEPLSNKYLAESIGEVTVTSEDSYQAPIVPFGVWQKEQEKEIINVEPETQDSTAEKDYGEELDDECPDGTRFDGFNQDSFCEYEKVEGRESSKRFMLALSAGGRQNTNVYQDFAFVTTADEKYNHKPQIITYELSLRYQLSDRFGLSSGFCYYGTTSDVLMTVQSIDNNDQLYLKQHARYLGMPLHLDWYPLKRNRFSVYAGAGGEARKCIYAKRGDERLKDNRIYMSVIALAGLKYEPVRNIGLFVEPQYSHSFLPETPAVRSYITDTPDLFTVKVGLSMGL